MAEVIAEWAGKERLFRLTFGSILDLEEICGKDAIGAIFLRVSTGAFKASDVYHILRLALVGGGMAAVEVKQLLLHLGSSPRSPRFRVCSTCRQSMYVT